MPSLSHIDRNGRAKMVDVSSKVPTRRRAKAQAVLRLSPEAFAAIERRALRKGDPLTVAKIAGIQAAKKTADLIPLCHPLPIEHFDIAFFPDARTFSIRLVCEVVTTAKTGIEMEAFVAASVASLAIYDMVKAIDPAAVITDIRLLEKSGGKTEFVRKT